MHPTQVQCPSQMQISNWLYTVLSLLELPLSSFHVNCVALVTTYAIAHHSDYEPFSNYYNAWTQHRTHTIYTSTIERVSLSILLCEYYSECKSCRLNDSSHGIIAGSSNVQTKNWSAVHGRDSICVCRTGQFSTKEIEEINSTDWTICLETNKRSMLHLRVEPSSVGKHHHEHKQQIMRYQYFGSRISVLLALMQRLNIHGINSISLFCFSTIIVQMFETTLVVA